jgi:Mlc titration factor MtfA (ptsG expression regulator)
MSPFIIIVLIAVAIYFVLRIKRKPSAVVSPAVTNYTDLLNTQIVFYKKLSAADKVRFEKMVLGFLAGVTIEGVGTKVTDLDKVMIASSAVVPIFGFPDWRYKNLTNIILYPDTFNQDFQFEGESRTIMGMVGSGYMNGQMLLSRAALVKGFSKAAGMENTAIHEFVHLLDKADGATDGIPENLLAHEYIVPWVKMMHREMHRIQAGKSDINPYAITNEAEFFAVVSEYFFEKPDQLQHKHPDLYTLLSRIFGQDPALTLID